MNNVRIALGLLVLGLLACGQPKGSSGHDTTFEDQPQNETVKQQPSNTSTVAKGVQPSAPAVEATSPLVTEGKLKTVLPEYRVPEKLREHINKYQPDLLPEKSPDFQVADQHLTIDAKEKKVTFSGTLKVNGRQDEPFELACAIDTDAVPWVCSDMTPTDESLAAQKRFQGTFKCLDTYLCDQVAVKLWVVIDGKLQVPQLFQAEGFQIRKALIEDEQVEEAMAKPPTQELPPKFQDRILPDQEPGVDEPETEPPTVPQQKEKPDKPSPRPSTPAPSAPQPLTDSQIDDLLKDPETTLEISEPISMPNPTVGKYSVPGIEALPAPKPGTVRIQAVGLHNRGRLQKSSELPASGPGFVSRDHGKMDFGTDVTINLIRDALGVVDKKFPARPPVVVASIANPTGGKLINRSGHAHASHQTGLDADIGIPSVRPVNDLWSACGGSCHNGSKMSDKMDEERFWFFLEEMNCAESKPVIAMFLDREIKKDLCRYVHLKSNEDMSNPKSCAFRTLQAIRHWPGHTDHVHVRLRCPEKEACRNSWVTLDNGSGC